MAPQTIASRYRLEREVGRGGMGSVWLATDQRLGREVALKQVGALPGQSAPDLARALREARSSAALNHPNVVAVYDAVEEDDHIWLVMEYVPGRTLSEVVAQDGPITPERAAWIGAQVADGLRAAHGAGTVHRDVKPGNVLVTGDDRAKISDFGIARTLGDETLTQSGFTTGTPAYFAPELVRGEDPTPAADVWALGATLYAAVEGRTPYPSQGNALAMLATIADGPPDPAERAGFLTEPLRRMLDPDPVSRWQMADCAHALRRLHLEHTAGGTHEQSPVATPAAPAPEPEPEPEPTGAWTPPPAPARQHRSRRGPLLVALLVVLLAGVAGLLVAQSLSGDGTQTAEAPSGARSSSTPASEAPAPTETATETVTSEPTSSAPPPQTSGGPESFVEAYYAALPEDTEAGWAMLSASFQDEVGSYGDYDGFWSTIDDVQVEETSPGGSGAVEVTLTYTTDGSTEREVRRIELDRDGSDWVIAGDEVVG